MSATLTVDRRRPDGPLATYAHASIDWLRDMARDALADPGADGAPPARGEAAPARSNGRHPAAPAVDRTAIYRDVQRHLERAESSLGARASPRGGGAAAPRAPSTATTPRCPGRCCCGPTTSSGPRCRASCA